MEEEIKTDVTVGGDNPTTGTENKQGDNKTLSFIDLLNSNKDYQSAHDKKVQEAIKTAETKWKELADTQKTEAEKLANMNKEQKLEYQLKKEQDEKEQINKKLNAYELKKQAGVIAQDKNLDITLLDLIDFEDITAEKINETIDGLSLAFNKAVEKAVNERLKEDTPVTKTSGMQDSQSKAIPLFF